jgi:hypothetical protein
MCHINQPWHTHKGISFALLEARGPIQWFHLPPITTPAEDMHNHNISSGKLLPSTTVVLAYELLSAV